VILLGAILLFIAAAVFVVAEMFLPSHGILGVCAVGCAVASVVMAYMVSQLLGLIFGVAVVLATPFVLYWAVKLYPKTAVGKRIMLGVPDSATGFEHEAQQLSQLVGKRGIATTMLRPAGTIELDDQRIDAISESEFIQPGMTIEVVRVNGMEVIVKAAEGPPNV